MSEGKHVYVAMVSVKKRIAALGLSKDRSAPAVMGGFAFRGIDDVYNLLCAIEAEESLMVLPSITSERTEYQENKGKLQTHVHLTMQLKFVSAIDGSSDTASAIGEGIDTGDKASAKAQSNAMKMAHLEVYKVPTEGLDVESYAEQVGPKRTPQREPSDDRQPFTDTEPSSAEALIIAKFTVAKTTDDIAEAEAEAARALADKRIVNGGRARMLAARNAAKSRLEAR